MNDFTKLSIQLDITQRLSHFTKTGELSVPPAPPEPPAEYEDIDH